MHRITKDLKSSEFYGRNRILTSKDTLKGFKIISSVF